jgi:hypothetical protein
MNEWLVRVAAALGSTEELSADEIDTLLEIARIAAHDSDDRRNAPILTYLIGRSRGDRPIGEVLDEVRRASTS